MHQSKRQHVHLTRHSRRVEGTAQEKDLWRTVELHQDPVQCENRHTDRTTGQYDPVGTLRSAYGTKCSVLPSGLLSPWAARSTPTQSQQETTLRHQCFHVTPLLQQATQSHRGSPSCRPHLAQDTSPCSAQGHHVTRFSILDRATRSPAPNPAMDGPGNVPPLGGRTLRASQPSPGPHC